MGELITSLRKLGLTAALLASSLGALWTTPASADCGKLCFKDLRGNEHCFPMLCEEIPKWWRWWRWPDPRLISPVDISPIARDLQSLLPSPAVPDGDSEPWILISPSSDRAFLIDLKNATLTEVVSGEQAVGR